MTNNDFFAGKLALVTGASRGIGAATAKILAAQGAHVVLLARTQSALEDLDDSIRASGGAATLFPFNLTRLEDIDKLGPSLHERFGRLDCLVAAASMLGPLSPAHQIENKDWDKVMKVNFHANVRLAHTLDPLLRAAPAGRMLFLTGSPVAQGCAYWGAYQASKAALESFAHSYSAEIGKTAMKVICHNPGPVDTTFLKEAFPGGFPGKTKTAEEAAQECVRLIAA